MDFDRLNLTDDISEDEIYELLEELPEHYTEEQFLTFWEQFHLALYPEIQSDVVRQNLAVWLDKMPIPHENKE